jgi:hypothetical protein
MQEINITQTFTKFISFYSDFALSSLATITSKSENCEPVTIIIKDSDPLVQKLWRKKKQLLRIKFYRILYLIVSQ